MKHPQTNLSSWTGSPRMVPWFIFSFLWLAGCSAATTALPTETSLPTPPTATPVSPSQETPETITIIPPTMTPALSASEKQAMTQNLIHAANAGDTPTVQRLIQEGADINGRDELGRTAVMAATHGNHVDTVLALIEAG